MKANTVLRYGQSVNWRWYTLTRVQRLSNQEIVPIQIMTKWSDEKIQHQLGPPDGATNFVCLCRWLAMCALRPAGHCLLKRRECDLPPTTHREEVRSKQRSKDKLKVTREQNTPSWCNKCESPSSAIRHWGGFWLGGSRHRHSCQAYLVRLSATHRPSSLSLPRADCSNCLLARLLRNQTICSIELNLLFVLCLEGYFRAFNALIHRFTFGNIRKRNTCSAHCWTNQVCLASHTSMLDTVAYTWSCGSNLNFVEIYSQQPDRLAHMRIITIKSNGKRLVHIYALYTYWRHAKLIANSTTFDQIDRHCCQSALHWHG